MIIDYILYLRDVRKISRGSINVHLTAILHFFTINNDDFTLTTRNFKLHLPYDDYESDNRSYTVEEIAQVIGSCDLRSKMMILLTASTGMRIGALHSLQISDLCKVEYDNSIVYRINVYARTHSHYYTYCTPECAEAIDEYKKYRQRYGEKLTDKSPLIREQFNVNNPFTINSPKSITWKGIEYIIDQTLKRSGVRKPGVVHMSHGLRKFFLTKCEGTSMKSINVKILLGHEIGVSGHYYRPAESDLLEDYMIHAADALTISDEHRLKDQIQQLETKHSEEWGALEEDVKELKQLLDGIGDGDPAHKKKELQYKIMKKLQNEVGYELQREYYEEQSKI